MTVIAAATDGEVAAIGSDSHGTIVGWLTSDYGPKVIHVFDKVAIGFSGSYTVERWIRRYFGPAMRKRERLWETDPDAFHEAVEDAWDGWRAWSADRGEWNTAKECDCIVAAPGIILKLESNGGVLRPGEPYSAIGTGTAVAVGAMAVLPDVPPMDAVSLAVSAAIRHATGCGGDPHVIEVTR